MRVPHTKRWRPRRCLLGRCADQALLSANFDFRGAHDRQFVRLNDTSRMTPIPASSSSASSANFWRDGIADTVCGSGCTLITATIEHMDRYSLPHGATGIESEDFALSFGPDRIVFAPKRADRKPEDEEPETHYTFSARQDSGVIDMHETTVLPDGSKGLPDAIRDARGGPAARFAGTSSDGRMVKKLMRLAHRTLEGLQAARGTQRCGRVGGVHLQQLGKAVCSLSLDGFVGCGNGR